MIAKKTIFVYVCEICVYANLVYVYRVLGVASAVRPSASKTSSCDVGTSRSIHQDVSSAPSITSGDIDSWDNPRYSESALKLRKRLQDISGRPKRPCVFIYSGVCYLF